MEKTLAPDKAEITKFSNAVGNMNLVNALPRTVSSPQATAIMADV